MKTVQIRLFGVAMLVALSLIVPGKMAAAGSLSITGGNQDVVGDAGGTNFNNPTGSLVGRGVPTVNGNWTDPGNFQPDPSFGNAKGISGYSGVDPNGVSSTLKLSGTTSLNFVYYGSGNAQFTNQFWVDPTGTGTSYQKLFTSGVNGQDDHVNLLVTPDVNGNVLFRYVITNTSTTLNNGSNNNVPGPSGSDVPGYFLGANPYLPSIGSWATQASSMFVGLSDGGGGGGADHDFSDLAVQINAVPEPATIASVAMGVLAAGVVAFRRRRSC